MLKKLTATGVLAFAVTGAAMAAAAPANAGTGNNGVNVLSGNQVIAPVTVVTTVCGNAINAVTVLSGAVGTCGDEVKGHYR
ncbi:chaplin family protein [Actinomadura sp. SCN-SB]|uniref:chaplin family protein n=1 Tax=Actinomadura sp. SCN-SB TaxID=3373092 RepID=UPI0037505771